MQTPTDQKYLAFLASCIAECDKEHSPEEIAEAEEVLRKAVQVSELLSPILYRVTKDAGLIG